MEQTESLNIAEKAAVGVRPMLIQTATKTEDNNVIPKVAPYTISPDLSNLENLWQFYSLQQGGEMADKLAKNGLLCLEVQVLSSLKSMRRIVMR